MSSRKEQKEQARIAREAKQQEHAASQARARRFWIIGGVVGLAAVAVIVVIVISSQNHKINSSVSEINARYAGLTQKSNVLGEPGAKATIVEYADLRCPFCQQFELDSMPTLINQVIKSGEAKLVFRNLTILDQSSPSGNDSTNAANYAAAVGLQNQMFPYINNFYVKQQSETTDYANETFLKSVAKGLTGINADEAWNNRSNPKATNQVQAATALAASRGVTGTPTFFVGKDEKSATKVDVTDLSNPQPLIDAVNALQ